MGNEDVPEDGVVHDEIEIEDFEYDPDADTFTYPCPCGDEFVVLKEDLMNGGKYAKCPSCSLMVLVIFNPEDLNDIIETKSAQKDARTSKDAGIKVTS